MKIYEYRNKNYPYLETYDAGAMFIGSYVLKLFLQVALVVLLAMTDVPDTFTSTMGGICLITSLNELAFFLTPVAYGKIRGKNLLADMGFEKKFSPWVALLCVPLAITVICFGSPLANAFIKLVELIGYKTENVTSVVVDSGSDLALTLVFVALIPAIAEEYLFRGNIARGLAKNGYFFAVMVSSTLFALMHGNPLQLVHQFIIGVVCAVLYFSTRSLVPSILLHFLNNAIALVLGYFESMGKPIDLPAWGWAIVCVAGLIASVLLLWAVVALSSKHKQKKGGEQTLSEVAAAEYARKKEAAEISEKLDGAETEAEKLVVRADIQEKAKKTRMKDKKALIYSFVLTCAVWIVSFIVNVV